MEQGGAASRMPRLRLDALLDEVQGRMDAARGARDRVHQLLEAVLSVGRELDLTHVLRRIVEAAASLVDARYAALGVIGPDGRTMSPFVAAGLTGEQIAAMGPFPSGKGLLGELIRHPQPLRLTDLSAHPASCGLPPNHPPMRSFLGVPVLVREKVFGNLYLTDKRDGRDFDADDEAVISTLAVAAGVAIDNARLYEEAQRQHRWLKASAEITRGLLSGRPRLEVLELIAQRAREITASELADVCAPVAGSRELAVQLALGGDASARMGLVVPMDGTLSGAACTTAAPVTSADLDADPRLSAGPRRFEGLGPAVAVPLGTAAGQIQGVLLLARATGQAPFASEEVGPLLGFADQAALALELAERRSDAEQLALLEDRDRIARDLHDLAIQRLFATGMTLQSASRFIQHTGAEERVTRAVEELDETIKIIRTTIFGLRTTDRRTRRGLRACVAQSVEKSREALGFAPRLSMDGLLDADVPPQVAEHVLAVLGEALSNAARHAQADEVEVSLRATGREVVLVVADDGIGIRPDGRRSGLENLTRRAEALGGSMELQTAPGEGTRLVWTAPLGTP